MRTANSWRRPYVQLRQQFQDAAGKGHGLTVEFGDFLDERAWEERWEVAIHELVPAAPRAVYPPKPIMGGRLLAGGQFSIAEFTVSFSKSCVDPASDRFGGFRVCGDTQEVETFRRLTETAGACLPAELRPKTPIPVALINAAGDNRADLCQDPFDAYGVWLSFIYERSNVSSLELRWRKM